MTRPATTVLASLALALSLASPAPAQAGVLAWLLAGAGTACAASERCSARAQVAKAAVADRARTSCAKSLGCAKLARDAADLRAHVSQGGRGLLARILAGRPTSGTVANPFAGSPQTYGYAQR